MFYGFMMTQNDCMSPSIPINLCFPLWGIEPERGSSSVSLSGKIAKYTLHYIYPNLLSCRQHWPIYYLQHILINHGNHNSEVNLDLDCWSKVSQGKLKLIICSANVCIISSETRHGSSSSGWYFVFVNVNGDKRPVFCKFWWCRISLIAHTISTRPYSHDIYLQYLLMVLAFSPLQSLTCIHTTPYPTIHLLKTTNLVHSSSMHSKFRRTQTWCPFIPFLHHYLIILCNQPANIL